eukprot:193703_1
MPKTPSFDTFTEHVLYPFANAASTTNNYRNIPGYDVIRKHSSTGGVCLPWEQRLRDCMRRVPKGVEVPRTCKQMKKDLTECMDIANERVRLVQGWKPAKDGQNYFEIDMPKEDVINNGSFGNDQQNKDKRPSP